MSRERALARRLRTLATLDEVIGALRSLSAQQFRAVRAPLRAARAYRQELDAFLGVLQVPVGRPVGPSGIVLIAADLGLVGDYTANLVREALALREEQGAGPVFCLGHRAVSPLARAGVQPVSLQPAPTSVASLAGLLLPLVDALTAARERGELAALWLVAARFEGAGRYAPMRIALLPVPAARDGPRLPPSPYCGSEPLRAIVLREYLYAALYETLLEALASEHGKRLVMAESARSWLSERIASTRRLAASLRRESSTQEVLEVAAAARAARGRA